MVIPFKKGTMNLSSAAGNDGYLIGSRCRACGAVAFPRREICHKCLSNDLAEVPLSNRGKLASFTVAWAAPSGFQPPLMLGYVDLPEGIRLLSMITGCDPSPHALELGQEMQLVFEQIGTDEAGNCVVAYKFRPVS